MFVRTKHLPNPHDPFQPLDLRWRRCHYLVRHQRRPSPDHDDRATFEGWSHLLDRRACSDSKDQERLAQRHPAVAAAYYLSRQARQAEPLKKAEVEARLLARQTDDAIAARCGLSAAAVGAYHDLFYSVRNCLDADIHIYTVVIGAKSFAGLTENDVDVFLKMVGYAHGPLMVDAALRYFRNPPMMPLRLDGLAAAVLDDLRLMLLIRKLILTMVSSSCAFVGKKLPHIPAATGAAITSPIQEELPDLSVAAFLREQVHALMPVDSPAILSFDQSALQKTPDQLEISLATLCG